MVTYYGMSDQVGHLSFYDSTGARGYDLTKPYSEKTAELIDKEARSDLWATSTSPAKAFALYGKTIPCRQKSGSKSF